MALNAGSPVPLYRQVMDDIRGQIERGDRVPGSRIPSEAQLSEQYAVSRITVRRAVEELVGIGLLTKRQGKGTYVNPPKLEHKIVQGRDTQSFVETCAKSGRRSSLETCGVGRVRPDEKVRSFLGLGADDEVVRLRRLGRVDGVPVMVEGEYLPIDEFAFLMEADLTDRAVFPLIRERTGRRPVNRGRCLLEVVRATSEFADVLGVPVSEPLFHIDAFLYDEDDRPLMVSRALIVGSLYAFNLV